MAKKQVKKTVKKTASRQPGKKAETKGTIILKNPTLADIDKIDAPPEVLDMIRQALGSGKAVHEVQVEKSGNHLMIQVEGGTCKSGCCQHLTISRSDGEAITADDVVSTLTKVAEDLMGRFDPDQKMMDVSGKKRSPAPATADAH